MRKVGCNLLFALLVLAGCSKTAPTAQEQAREAAAALETKNFGRAVELTAELTKAEPGNAQSHFLRAQALAMVGDVDGALRSLQSAAGAGFSDLRAIDNNPNLNPLRGDPQFDAWRAQFDTGFAAVPNASGREVKAGDASIREVNGQQVIKAGDIQLTLPKD
ncbi:MAG: TPR end-of-group domain-containing protein [Massilia sp.]